MNDQFNSITRSSIPAIRHPLPGPETPLSTEASGRVAQIIFRFGCGADIPVCRFWGLSSPRIPRQTVSFGPRIWKTSQPAGSKACPTIWATRPSAKAEDPKPETFAFPLDPIGTSDQLISLVPKKAKSSKRRAFYRKPPPKPGRVTRVESREPKAVGRAACPALRRSPRDENNIGHPVSPTYFELREDGSIAAPSTLGSRPSTPFLIYASDTPFVRLYYGNCLELLDAIAAKYPDGRFDAIFADPPYFLSNGGITCHAGKMVKVDKGDWDVSRGPELNHEFNTEWLRRCQRVLKPNGTIWVTGTHHVIFSIGYALQQLGYKILNDIAWEKPNPPPNLSCRYFTHSTETVLWAAKNEKSKHVFNYQEMRKVTGKQMKTVWRDAKGGEEIGVRSSEIGNSPSAISDLPSPISASSHRSLIRYWFASTPVLAG